MALKSTTTPFDQMILTEWRTQICAYKGIDYSGQATAWQTMLNDTINRAHEYLSQRAAHHPWGQQETTKTITAGTDTTYSMPASFRHLVALHEVATDGSILQVNLTEKAAYYRAPVVTSGSHPWVISTTPYWFYDGMTADEPPVQQWRRVGDDNTGATAYILYRPYFNLLGTSGQDTYPYLPAAESSALLHRILAEIEAFDRNWDGAQFHKALMEDEIAALEIADRDTVETPRQLGFEAEFGRLLG